MLLVTATARGGVPHRRIAAADPSDAVRFQAEFLGELLHLGGGVVTIDDADPRTVQPIRRVSTAWIRRGSF